MANSPAPAETPKTEPVAPPPNPNAGATPPAPESKSAAEPEAPEGQGSLVPPVEGEAKPPESAKDEPKAATPEPIDLSKLSLPEGVKADDPALAKLVETLGDAKLSPAQRAEALVAQHHEIIGQAAKAAADQIQANYKSVNDAWVKEVVADPVIGGANQAEALSAIAKAIDTWSPDPKATRQALGLTGAGNNPAILRTFHAMAKALSEGGPAQGAVPQGKKSATEIFYGGGNAGNQ